jgi:Chaperone of endosialidase
VAFDFPQNPTVGQKAYGYTWNGYGWAGGPGQAATVTEQFFDVTGLSSKDIPVPSWAKGVVIEGRIYHPNATPGVPVLYVSTDGTTFHTAASDYVYEGPYHNVASPFYGTVGNTAAAYAPLTTGNGHANASVPFVFRVDMGLARSAGQLLSWRTYTSAWVDTGARQSEANWFQSYLNATGAGNTIKIIRIVVSNLVWGSNSWVKVRWTGDSAALPVPSGIADAPNDAFVYLRGQNSWQSGGTLSGGSLTINGAWTSLNLNKPASGTGTYLRGQMAGKDRWIMYLGDNAAESGSNAGSLFNILRCADDGTQLGSPFYIVRATGVVNMPILSVAHSGTGFGLTNTGGIGADGNGLVFEGASIPCYGNKIGANGWILLACQGGTSVGGISCANGTTTIFNTTSDGRLKEDMQSFDAGPILDAINVYDFQWKGQETRGYGVIAQEAVTVFPDAVFHDEENDMWSTDYSKFVSLLLQEVKALRARVAALEAVG